MSNYIWRGRHAFPRGTTRRAHRDVTHMTGVGGTTVLRVGPDFGDVNADTPEHDPVPELRRELAAQRRARGQ